MKTSLSVVLPAYNDNLLRAMLALKVGSRELPSLQPDEVLVSMEGAPCNPSDIAFLRGGYNIVKPVPAVPGFEGTGTVVDTGSSAKPLLNKRVSCFVQEDKDGTWGEFFIARKKDCIVVKDGVPMEEAACLSINPLTAWALFELVEQSGFQAFIQNAAGGQVPRILQALAAKKDIPVINLVRKSAQAEQMRQNGLQYVLDTSDEKFEADFGDLCHELKPRLAFDAVGGGITGQMLNAMPGGSKVVLYGALSGAPLQSVDPLGVIFHRKAVIGFNLNDWLKGMPEDEFRTVTDSIQDMILAGELVTPIQGKFTLAEAVTGLRTYIKSMSAGKIIFTP